jgi:hypothetical protein
MPFDHLPHEMTEEQYRRLPEEYARASRWCTVM